jgi:hypothetical protein
MKYTVLVYIAINQDKNNFVSVSKNGIKFKQFRDIFRQIYNRDYTLNVTSIQHSASIFHTFKVVIYTAVFKFLYPFYKGRWKLCEVSHPHRNIIFVAIVKGTHQWKTDHSVIQIYNRDYTLHVTSIQNSANGFRGQYLDVNDVDEFSFTHHGIKHAP